MMITAIVAWANSDLEDRIIGVNGDLPWERVAEDMAFFRKTTKGNIVLMGRKTWESLDCKILPGRVNIVVSKIGDYLNSSDPDFWLVKSVEDGLKQAKYYWPDKEVFIIGGSQIYNACLEKGLVDRLLVTHMRKPVDVEGSNYYVTFPDVDLTSWKVKTIQSNDIFEIKEYLNEFGTSATRNYTFAGSERSVDTGY